MNTHHIGTKYTFISLRNICRRIISVKTPFVSIVTFYNSITTLTPLPLVHTPQHSCNALIIYQTGCEKLPGQLVANKHPPPPRCNYLTSFHTLLMYLISPRVRLLLLLFSVRHNQSTLTCNLTLHLDAVLLKLQYLK